ncbi:hypothetical protein [Leminorella grimontii]|uniref:hypothetical protein n=1 Tax=Leminorella grimontii TaxID=82981 RepID=UPI00208BD93B|nr:hypothetical protein [Leminorella grimontii]GKX59026.1 hypothetical protein SOASR031_13410 [Leminorella grimontii]
MGHELEEALLDVRKAYRLIEDFQRRLITALEFMRNELKLEYYYQHSRNKVPRGISGIAGNKDSGRRFLPLNDMSVFWYKHSGQDAPHDYPNNGDFMVEVYLSCDSGNGHHDNHLSTPEESHSLLHICVIACKADNVGRQNWFNLWEYTDYPNVNEVKELEDYPGFSICCEEIDMINLKNKETLMLCLDGFRQRMSEKLGIVFN